MFKKTLIAATVAGVAGYSAGAFAAADLVNATDQGNTTTANVISFEGAASDTTIAGPSIFVQLGAEYSTGDIITITFSGATLDTTASAPTATYADDTADTGGGDTDAATLGMINIDANSVVFRVTALTDGAADGISTTGGELTIGGLVFTPDSVLASATNTVTATYKATIAGDPNTKIDTSGSNLSVTILDVDAQFTLSAPGTPFDGVIDVATSRKEFVGGTSDVLAGLAITNVAAPAAGPTPALLSGEDTVFTIAGDFSFLNDAAVDTDEDGVVTTAEATAFAVAVAGGGFALTDVGTDFKSLEITTTEGDETPDSASVTIESDDGGGDGVLTLAKTGFSVSGVVGYTDNGATTSTKSLSSVSAGEFDINGLIAHVPLFVNDDNHATVVTVANYTANTPDIELVIYDATDSIEVGVVGQANPNGLTVISDWVKTAATNAGVSVYAFDVIVNEESDNVDVSAQYVRKSSGSRAVINVVEE